MDHNRSVSAFAKIKAAFDVNWTSVLVGWEGLWRLSPRPRRWTEFPPLISTGEITSYAEKRLEASADRREQRMIIELMTVDLGRLTREEIRDMLESLSGLDGGDPAMELRKWRLVLLEQVLEGISNDPVYGLIALSEFWQEFGRPPDSPHEAQGVGNHITPSEYYRQENLDRLLARHREWIETEKKTLKRI